MQQAYDQVHAARRLQPRAAGRKPTLFGAQSLNDRLNSVQHSGDRLRVSLLHKGATDCRRSQRTSTHELRHRLQPRNVYV